MLGAVAVLAVLAVGGLIWIARPRQQEALPEPLAQPEIPQGLTADGRPYLGHPDAPVEIVDFSDFQCPHCKNFAVNIAPKVMAEYVSSGQARLVFRHFPILDDPEKGAMESTNAAIAATCAKEQDAFWELHDLLFAKQPAVRNSGAFTQSALASMAHDIGLDMEAFSACMTSQEAADFVAADRQAALELELNATPTIVIGSEHIVGGDLDKIREAMKKALGS
jgi:protein-disulfide isomerase